MKQTDKKPESAPAAARKKLGDLLVDKGYVTSEAVKAALAEQAVSGKRLGSILVEQNLITEEQLIETISERLSIPRLSLASMVIDRRITQMISVELARRYSLIPVFAIGNTLTIAMADPLNIIAIDELRYHTGKDVKRAVAKESEIKQAIDQYYSMAESFDHLVGSTNAETRRKPDPIAATQVSEAESPVVKLVNLILSKAIRDRASDIHIEPDEDNVRIRYRIHGAMREEASPPKALQNEVISRVKIAADLDVSEKRLPQDGRFHMNADGHDVDLRVNTMPTIHGEKIVIRLLDRRNLLLSFPQLGFGPALMDQWNQIIRKPEGLVLISGPTSSGKTSTLYASLQEINSIEKNIITVEDPVEYSLPIINQVQINEKAGLTFPITLRSILRQNPDIIMIGEIRDTETAQMAIRSSLTGHLVLSTIHTNDAPSAITRLIDMGIEPYLVAASVKGVLAQRLVRLNCQHCLERYQPSDTILSRAGLLGRTITGSFSRGVGCPQCRNTGFARMTGIFELVETTPAITELVMSGGSISRVREVARAQGYVPLFEAGMEKVFSGTICLEELLKETASMEDPDGAVADLSRSLRDANPIQV